MSNLIESNEIVPVIMESDNGELVVSSRDIAAGIGKEHYDIIKKIRSVLNDGEFSAVEYIDAKGEKRPEYLLPKDSFILLLMNYQGYNDFKRAYIKRFNEMENALKEQYIYQAEIVPAIKPKRKSVTMEEKLKIAEILKAYSDLYRDRYDGRVSQNIDRYVIKKLTGKDLLPLPSLDEKYYTAAQVAKILGITAYKVGQLANQNNLKNDQYGKYFVDKARYSNKEIESFRYNKAGINRLKAIIAV